MGATAFPSPILDFTLQNRDSFGIIDIHINNYLRKFGHTGYSKIQQNTTRRRVR
jgi:hypothetical protein